MSTAKIGWGARIAILYLGFMGLIIALVTMSMKQDFDLVSDQYYQEELAYQHTIDANKNGAALSAPVTITASAANVVIDFPAEFAGAGITGSAYFYSPVTSKFDRTFSISVNGNTMSIPKSSLQNARYTVKLNWVAGGKAYYQETDLNLH